MIITKKALPRRTFLRGVGATLALPLLDAMIPAATALAATPAAPVRRLGFVFMPMGCDITRWTPPGEDKLDELSPILSSLAPVKEHVTVLTNLELQNAYPGTHATSNSAFLSAARAKHTESTDYYLGTTVDQIAAQQIGRETQLPSLELAMDMLQIVGQCDNGYACVYQNNLSWSSPDHAAAGRGASAARVREPLRRRRQQGRPPGRAAPPRQPARLREGRHRPASAARSARPTARKVDQYLDTVREVERRIQKAERDVADNPLPDLDRPVGVPAAYADHARLMFDLQVLALAGRRHARHHVPARPRDQQPHLSRDRRARSAPPALAPRQRPGEDRADGEDQRVPRLAVRRVPRQAEGDARKATARCSTTRSISTAAAWATRTCTTTPTCRSSSPAARPAA